MQSLASSPPISPLIKRYDKGSQELILQSELQPIAEDTEPAHATNVNQERKGKKKTIDPPISEVDTEEIVKKKKRKRASSTVDN
jgi:hypothetical protein